MSQFEFREPGIPDGEASQVIEGTSVSDRVGRGSLRKLVGIGLIGLGYLLSPLCWWNDLIFNLPVAYGFGYLCKLLDPGFFLPGAIAGYWLSNLVGIVLMQFGLIDVVQNPAKERNFKKELLMGVATSTAYTVAVVLVIQLKIIDISALLPADQGLDLSTLLPFLPFGEHSGEWQ